MSLTLIKNTSTVIVDNFVHRKLKVFLARIFCFGMQKYYKHEAFY